MSIGEPLTDIFREVFDDDDITLSPEMTADDVDGDKGITRSSNKN